MKHGGLGGLGLPTNHNITQCISNRLQFNRRVSPIHRLGNYTSLGVPIDTSESIHSSVMHLPRPGHTGPSRTDRARATWPDQCIIRVRLAGIVLGVRDRWQSACRTIHQPSCDIIGIDIHQPGGLQGLLADEVFDVGPLHDGELLPAGARIHGVERIASITAPFHTGLTCLYTGEATHHRNTLTHTCDIGNSRDGLEI
jgi:hypothetical protein